MIYDKFDNLYIKIVEKLGSKDIQTQGDIINLEDLKKACNEGLKKYNFYLIDQIPNRIKEINRHSRSNQFPYIEKDYPTLTNIKSYVLDDDNFYIRCTFQKENGLDFILFSLNENNEVIICSTSLKNGEDKKFLCKNNIVISSMLNVLQSFINEFPKVEYTWDKDHRNAFDQSISDGVFTSEIFLNYPDKTYLGLKSAEDCITATTRTYKYGELYDYLSMYQDSYIRKTAININDLNPFIKLLVDKYLKNENNIKKQMIKEN